MGSKNEIFISYAHADNKSPFEGEDGWVSALHHALEIYLAQLLGKKRRPAVWRDPKLQGNDFFDDELVGKLADAAALICILSPSYVDSEWCQRELHEFWRKAHGNGGDKATGKARVFKVVKMPMPLEDHPREVQRLLGYDFFKEDPDKGSFIPLDPSIDPALKRDYWTKLNDLAQDLRRLLIAQEDRGDRPPSERPAAGEDRREDEQPKVYLAETIHDLKDERDEIRRDLLRHGIEVRPDRNLPLFLGDLEAAVREQLADCRLSVHLIGSNYGIVPEGSSESVGALQNALAAERSRQGGLQRLIWIPEGLQPAEDKQRAFLETLRADNRNHLGSDLLESSLEELKTVLYQRLEAAAQAPRGAARTDDSTRLYLICDERDGERTGPLEDYLYERGMEITLPLFEAEDAEQVRIDHEESLSTCDAILIYWGEGSEAWRRRKLRELQHVKGYDRRTRPLLASAIYVAPPASPRKQRLRSRELLVMRGGETFDPSVFGPFLEQIENAQISARR